MSNSDKLSESLRGNIKNLESQGHDLKIKDVINQVILPTLQEKYPSLKFGLDKNFPTRTLESMVESGVVRTQEKTYIKPDGGLVWVEIDGVKRFILVSEQKRQGTNDKGKNQAAGNAVERLGKNVIGCEVLFGEEKITPLVVFLQGCDFYEPESTIPDRVRTIAKFQPMNQINLYKKQLQKYTWFAGSYFMRGHSKNQKSGTSDWTSEEMISILSEVAIGATEYYLKEYGKS